MPARRSAPVLLLVPVFLAVWVIVWAAAVPDRVAEDGLALAIVIYVAVAIVTVLVLIVPWLYTLAGRARLDVSPAEVSLRRAVGPLGFTRRIPAERVTDVRTVERGRIGFWSQSPFLAAGLTGGPVLIESRRHLSIRCGQGIDDTRAEQLVARIREALS